MGLNFLYGFRHKGAKFKGTKMKNYRNLIVWQKSMAFVNDIYKVTKDFPDDEKFGIISQIRRSCRFYIRLIFPKVMVEIPTNDYINFPTNINGILV